MIRKVPNIRAWVLKKEDLPILFKTNRNLIDACRFLKTIYCLPILSNTPWYYNPLFDDLSYEKSKASRILKKYIDRLKYINEK